MSVRNKAVLAIISRKFGRLSFNSTGCATMPEEDYQREWEKADLEFSAVIQDIDWHRVLLTASARHLNEDHPISDVEPNVCGKCLLYALLEDPGAYDPHKRDNPYRTAPGNPTNPEVQ